MVAKLGTIFIKRKRGSVAKIFPATPKKELLSILSHEQECNFLQVTI